MLPILDSVHNWSAQEIDHFFFGSVFHFPVKYENTPRVAKDPILLDRKPRLSTRAMACGLKLKSKKRNDADVVCGHANVSGHLFRGNFMLPGMGAKLTLVFCIHSRLQDLPLHHCFSRANGRLTGGSQILT